jgi:copper resistance protein C
MRLRACFPPFAAVILVVVGSALRPNAACADRAESGADLLRQPPAAALNAFKLRPDQPPAARPARLGQQFAHATLVRTFPEKGAEAPVTVAKVDVWYNEAIRDELVALAVINADGVRVDKRDSAIDSADGSHVSTSVETLTPGEYTVRYRAVSADGHLVSGAWVFLVHGQ